MKAIILSEPGSTDNLSIRELPGPVIQNNEVLVKVRAISINPVDVKTRVGNGVYRYGNVSRETELILGWDISGEVTESKSDLFKAGDEVFGMVNFPGVGKAYAEYVAAPASHLALKPANISHEEAAAATLAALTALQVLRNAGVKAGERVLIHAAAGGVGHYAVQLARHLGAYVIGTSSAVNRDFILSLGANEHIDYKTQSLPEATADIDFVLDSLGADNILQSLDVIKEGGRITSIVAQFTEEITAKAQAGNISGGFYLVQSNGDDMKTLAGLLEKGIVKSYISKTYSFDKMAEAHLQVESCRTVGKVVVSL
jgi:NADPH:quinone reductase-like Zn-dependent oxidoreductase